MHRRRSRMANRERVCASDRCASARARSGCGNLRRMPDAGRANRGSASRRVRRDFSARPRPVAHSHALRKDQSSPRKCARASQASSILGIADGTARGISAYEIHMGNVERAAGTAAPFRIVERNGDALDMPDGAINRDGTVVGYDASWNFRERHVARDLSQHDYARAKGSPPARGNTAGRLARGGIRSPGRCGRGQCRSADAPKA